MKIRLNGEPHELAAPLTVTALLAELGIDPRRVAVEHNQIVVKRAAYDQTLVDENDEVEIVNFVGGGGAPLAGPCVTASTVDAARDFQRAATIGLSASSIDAARGSQRAATIGLSASSIDAARGSQRAATTKAVS